MLTSIIIEQIKYRLKAVVAFFLTGLATLIIQSIEQSGLDVPASAEEWIMSLAASAAAAVAVALAVHETRNGPPPRKGGR